MSWERQGQHQVSSQRPSESQVMTKRALAWGRTAGTRWLVPRRGEGEAVHIEADCTSPNRAFCQQGLRQLLAAPGPPPSTGPSGLGSGKPMLTVAHLTEVSPTLRCSPEACIFGIFWYFVCLCVRAYFTSVYLSILFFCA